jgi:hypothetical protein
MLGVDIENPYQRTHGRVFRRSGLVSGTQVRHRRRSTAGEPLFKGCGLVQNLANVEAIHFKVDWSAEVARSLRLAVRCRLERTHKATGCSLHNSTYLSKVSRSSGAVDQGGGSRWDSQVGRGHEIQVSSEKIRALKHANRITVLMSHIVLSLAAVADIGRIWSD